MNRKLLALLLACALLTALLCGCTQVTSDRTLDGASAPVATSAPEAAAPLEQSPSEQLPTEPEPTEEVVNDPNSVGYNG